MPFCNVQTSKHGLRTMRIAAAEMHEQAVAINIARPAVTGVGTGMVV